MIFKVQFPCKNFTVRYFWFQLFHNIVLNRNMGKLKQNLVDSCKIPLPGVKIAIGLSIKSLRFFFQQMIVAQFLKYLKHLIVVVTSLIADNLGFIVKNKFSDFIEFWRFDSPLNMKEQTVHFCHILLLYLYEEKMHFYLVKIA